MVVKNNIFEISNISKVCKLWYSVSCDQFLWKYINLANRKFNYNKFISFTIDTNRFKYTKSLNLSGLCELKHDDLELILKQSACLQSLLLSDCKKIKSESLKLIADYCPYLEHLNIASFSVGFSFLLIKFFFISLVFMHLTD